ncbi:MAG: TIGR04255 family protein [Rhodopirellula sp.]|nr:TIGR04255 family protein [Rhodopirellula sp.]
MASKDGPTFRNPPVVEVILGAQFSKLDLPLSDLACFHSELRSDWPNSTEAPTIEPQFETFGDDRLWASTRNLQFTNRPDCRFQFRNANDDKMIQVQRTRLHVNWMGNGADYPRYETIRQLFADVLSQFKLYLKSLGIAEPRINQWEVTYLNHIPAGDLWKSANNWTFSKLVGDVSVSSCELESFSGEWHWVLAEQTGRLHLDWKHARTESDANESKFDEIVRLNFTARGSASDEQSLFDGFDIGHKAIVNTFTECASDFARSHWQLETDSL